MFRKLVISVLIFAMLLCGCTPAVSQQQEIYPVDQSKPSVKTEGTQVPAGGTIKTAEGKVLTTPQALPVAIPVPTPVFQGEYDGLSIYYLYKPVDFEEMAVALVPVGSLGMKVSLLDTPVFGPADIVAIVVIGTAIVGYIVYQTALPTGSIYYEDMQDLAAILALWTTVSAYIPVTEEHKSLHTVVAGSTNVATQVMQDLSGRWPPDPNEQDPARKILCYVLKNGSQIVRYLVWAGVELSATGLPRGNISWWQHGPSGPEAYGYKGKSLRTMENVPTDLQGKGYSIVPTSCDNFTPPFQLLGQ